MSHDPALRREAWFEAYLSTILQREVRDLAQIEGLTALPRLLDVLAARATGLVNVAELSRSTALAQTTLKRYLALLNLTFLVDTLPAWTANLSQRLVKSPKLLLTDTGLLAQLLGLDGETLRARRDLAGPLLETFVAMEVRKQLGWSRTRARLFHFRTATGHGVDLVLETRDRRLVGIEVKAAATVGGEDFRGLRRLAEATGKRFLRGVLLYAGGEVLPFGPRLSALPVGTLWGASDTRTRGSGD